MGGIDLTYVLFPTLVELGNTKRRRHIKAMGDNPNALVTRDV